MRWTSERKIAKSIFTKGASRRSGGCALKVARLTPGDLRRVLIGTGVTVRAPDRGAGVSRGHSVRWAASRSGGLKSLWRPGEGRHIRTRG